MENSKSKEQYRYMNAREKKEMLAVNGWDSLRESGLFCPSLSLEWSAKQHVSCLVEEKHEVDAESQDKSYVFQVVEVSS